MSRIAGRYELKAILGTGGTGVVYRALDHELNEEVAIKILPPAKAGEGDVSRLKREVIAARKITHPNVIRLHEFGLNDREGYLSMEILPGGSLWDRSAKGPIPLDEALRIAIGVCDGLAAAHAEGIIHRDVKPQNVLFDKSGRPKIVDFGLARGLETTSSTIGFSGTPQYMSPESAEGHDITTKSDVYSLGVMLFEIFCGRRPFLASSLGRLVVMHTKEAPPAPRSLAPSLPVEIEEVVLRALEKEPAKRTQGAQEIADVLRRVQATVAPGDAAEPRVTGSRSRVTTEPPPMTLVRGTLPRQRRAIALLSVGAAVLLAGTGGFLAVMQPWKTNATPTPFPTAPPIAAASATPAIVASAAPVATTTPTPSKPATPVPTRTAIAAITKPIARPSPTATAAAVTKKTGSLLVRSKGTWVKVVVDGKVVDENTPMPSAVTLSAGPHKVLLTNAAASYSKEVVVDVKPGRQTTLVVEPLAAKLYFE